MTKEYVKGAPSAYHDKSGMCDEASAKVDEIVSTYLTSSQEGVQAIEPKLDHHEDISSQINAITDFMDALEVSMDAKMGIARVKAAQTMPHVNGEECSVMIRDARDQKSMESIPKPHDLEESYRIIAANRARGALYLIQQCKGDQQSVADDVMRHLDIFDDAIKQTNDNRERANLIKYLDYKVLDSLEKSDLSLAETPLRKKSPKQLYEDSIDLANLKEAEHPTIISISSNLGNKENSLHKVTALVPVRPFSDTSSVMQNEEWYRALDDQRRALVDPIKEALNDGKHQKPTQLGGFLGGVSNFIYQTSDFVDGSGKSVGRNDEKYKVLRSGTIVLGRGKIKDSDAVHESTRKNAEWKYELGVKTIHTLNHEPGIQRELSFIKKSGKKVQNRPISIASFTTANRGDRIDDRGTAIVDSSDLQSEECKSGKDRTGLQVLESDLVVIERFAKSQELDADNARKTMLETYYTAIAAGGSGCTRGIYGINGKGTMANLGKTARIKSVSDYIAASQNIAELNHVDPKNSIPASYKLVETRQNAIGVVRDCGAKEFVSDKQGSVIQKTPSINLEKTQGQTLPRRDSNA